MKVKNRDTLVLSEYITCKTLLDCKCAICGHEFRSIPNNLLIGKGCVLCGLKCSANKNRMTKEQFEKDLYKKNSTIMVIGSYINARTKIECSCIKCNHIWSATPTNLLCGHGCPNCEAIRKSNSPRLKTAIKFASDLSKVDPNILAVGEYAGSHNNIELRCKKCHKTWVNSPTHLLSGEGCPHCKSSTGERRIHNFLDDNGIFYIPQKKFCDLHGLGGGKLSYDFYLPHCNMLIEFQGQFHDGTVPFQKREEFIKQASHDVLKRDYASRNGFNLLEIWYKDLKNINNILSDTLLNSKITKDPLTTTVT